MEPEDYESIATGYDKITPGTLSDSGILAQLESTDIIVEIRDFLLGVVKDPEGGIIYTGKPLVKKNLLDSIIQVLRANVNRNINLSNLDYTEIRNMQIDLVWALADLFTMNASEVDEDKRTVIFRCVEHMIYCSYKRALSGLERKTARTVMRDVMTRQVTDVKKSDEGGIDKKPGFFSWIRQ